APPTRTKQPTRFNPCQNISTSKILSKSNALMAGAKGNLTGLKKAPCFGDFAGDSETSANSTSFQERGIRRKPQAIEIEYETRCFKRNDLPTAYGGSSRSRSVKTDFLSLSASFRVERRRKQDETRRAVCVLVARPAKQSILWIRRHRTRGRDESGLSVGRQLDCSRPGDCGAGADRAAPTRPGERELPAAQEPCA